MKYTDFVFDTLGYEIQRELPNRQYVTEKSFGSTFINDAIDYWIQRQLERPDMTFRIIQVRQVSECREIL